MLKFFGLRKYVLFAALAVPFPPVQEFADLEAGLLAMREGRLPEALAALDRQKQLTPEDPRSYFFSSLILYQTNQPLQAMNQMEKAVELEPSNGKYRLLFADMLFKNGFKFRALEALEPFKEISRVRELLTEEIWVMQEIFFQLGQYEDALTALKVLEERELDNDSYYFRKAQLEMGRNNLDAALDSFQMALDKTERKAEAFYGIGLIQYQQGKMVEAAESLSKAVEAKPGHAEFVHLYASILLAQQKPEEALKTLSTVEDQAEKFPKIWDAIARSYRQLRDFENARIYSEKFIQGDSAEKEVQGTQQRVHNLLQEGQQLIKEGKRPEAMKRFQEVLQSDPDNYLANNYLAGMYLLQRQWDQAYFHLSRMLEKNPDAFETNFLTANFYYYRRQYKEALSYAQKAFSIQPGFAELRNLLGNVHYALGNREKAKLEYEAAMKLDPEREEYRLNFESIP
jgi:tetratricopeptide (TPR) repeat protein